MKRHDWMVAALAGWLGVMVLSGCQVTPYGQVSTDDPVGGADGQSVANFPGPGFAPCTDKDLTGFWEMADIDTNVEHPSPFFKPYQWHLFYPDHGFKYLYSEQSDIRPDEPFVTQMLKEFGKVPFGVDEDGVVTVYQDPDFSTAVMSAYCYVADKFPSPTTPGGVTLKAGPGDLVLVSTQDDNPNNYLIRHFKPLSLPLP